MGGEKGERTPGPAARGQRRRVLDAHDASDAGGAGGHDPHEASRAIAPAGGCNAYRGWSGFKKYDAMILVGVEIV